jgi:hypothetical protein
MPGGNSQALPGILQSLAPLRRRAELVTAMLCAALARCTQLTARL